MPSKQDLPTPIGVHSGRPDEYVPDGTTFKLADCTHGSVWLHYRGTKYMIDMVARWSTNGPDEGAAVIIYHSAGNKPCARFAREFLDGRFRPVDDDPDNFSSNR